MWMAKFDARERQSTDRPVPEEVRRFLAGLVDASTATGEIVDIYEAAGMPKPSLSDLGPGFTARERIRELINRYTNQQLTSAEVVVELIEPAREVAAEGNRGTTFDPPLSEDELAFYDAVSSNESAVELQGEDVLAMIARELVDVMRRDVETDWTVRDDMRANLRSSIKRLLVKYKYPPDKQPEAIQLVLEQVEAPAPRYAA